MIGSGKICLRKYIGYFFIKADYHTLCRALSDAKWEEARCMLRNIRMTEDWQVFFAGKMGQPTVKRKILRFCTLHGSDTILLILAWCMKTIIEYFRVPFSYIKA